MPIHACKNVAQEAFQSFKNFVSGSFLQSKTERANCSKLVVARAAHSTSLPSPSPQPKFKEKWLKLFREVSNPRSTFSNMLGPKCKWLTVCDRMLKSFKSQTSKTVYSMNFKPLLTPTFLSKRSFLFPPDWIWLRVVYSVLITLNVLIKSFHPFNFQLSALDHSEY